MVWAWEGHATTVSDRQINARTVSYVRQVAGSVFKDGTWASRPLGGLWVTFRAPGASVNRCSVAWNASAPRRRAVEGGMGRGKTEKKQETSPFMYRHTLLKLTGPFCQCYCRHMLAFPSLNRALLA